MLDKRYFTLFACCIPIKGTNRSLICDIQRQEFFFINNEVYDLLMQFEQTPYKEIIENISIEDKPHIESLVTYFVEQEIGFFCDDISAFPKISMQYESPLVISNCIIDFDKSSNHNIAEISKQLCELGCRDLQFRFHSVFKVDEINHILKETNIDRVQSIEILLPYYKSIETELTPLTKKHVIISSIIIFDAPKDENLYEQGTSITFTTKKIDLCKSCGAISKKHFTLHLETFQEAFHHNSCLNQKISIDVNGEIKNCPSMEKSFGNISSTSLKEIALSDEFRKLWNINKDQINTCKDCEFRYVCSDCRAFLEVPEDIFSKPLKCGYDPYTNEWEEWSSNPLKEQAINYYKL